jgi:ribokinase
VPAVAASRLGARTELLGCVGDDPIGSTLLDALARNGVACAAVKVAEATTSGVAMIVVDDNGANTIVVIPVLACGRVRQSGANPGAAINAIALPY